MPSAFLGAKMPSVLLEDSCKNDNQTTITYNYLLL